MGRCRSCSASNCRRCPRLPPGTARGWKSRNWLRRWKRRSHTRDIRQPASRLWTRPSAGPPLQESFASQPPTDRSAIGAHPLGPLRRRIHRVARAIAAHAGNRPLTLLPRDKPAIGAAEPAAVVRAPGIILSSRGLRDRCREQYDQTTEKVSHGRLRRVTGYRQIYPGRCDIMAGPRSRWTSGSAPSRDGQKNEQGQSPAPNCCAF